MNTLSIRKLRYPLVLLFVLVACAVPVLPLPAASSPTMAPGSIGTIVFETAMAAQTGTALVMPSPTETATSTPFPTSTPTETPTSTPTVIFIIPTATKPFEPTSAGQNCQLAALTPFNPVLAPRSKFDVEWTLKNTGSDIWLQHDVDFRYTSGTDMHKVDAYDLPISVAPSSQVTITVPMVAPSKPGSYTTTWSLVFKKETICKVSASVTVK